MNKESACPKKKRGRSRFLIQIAENGAENNRAWRDAVSNDLGFSSTDEAKRHIRYTPNLHKQKLRIVAVRWEGVPTPVKREPVIRF